MALKVISLVKALTTIRLFPVNSSAPGMTTSIRPTVKAVPAMKFVKPMPNLGAMSKVTTVASRIPKPM